MEGARCRVGVSYGPESELYSFPGGNPMNRSRLEAFSKAVESMAARRAGGFTEVPPVAATEEELLLFHTKEYVDFVKESSRSGGGALDYGDTPSFKGVYDASLYPVGNTLNGVRLVMEGRYDHFFNPVGGLHHARSDRAGGFCVFNDAAIAVRELTEKRGLKRVAYVDIDAHHGDGVFYAFESDPRVAIADIHEDGRFLYPGTGGASETGSKGAEGTKVNIPMRPWAGDVEFVSAFEKVEAFVRDQRPEFILFQCGADSLDGDPIAQLSYTPEAHRHAAAKLHALSHEVCQGRMLAMGGGGYDPSNVSAAWTAVIEELLGGR